MDPKTLFYLLRPLYLRSPIGKLYILFGYIKPLLKEKFKLFWARVLGS